MSGVAVAKATSTTSYTPIAVTFFDNSHIITVAPQPTATSVQPPGTTIPVLTYSDGEVPSNGGCSSGGDTTGCGKIDCALFGRGGECGFFGCDGGCGLGFCGGGCGLLGCGPGCGAGKSNCVQQPNTYIIVCPSCTTLTYSYYASREVSSGRRWWWLR